jgi:hypothetical protein
MLSGSLVTTAWRWRRRLPDMEGSCEYIEKAVADSRQGVVLQLGGLNVGLTTPHSKNKRVMNCHKGPRTGIDYLDKKTEDKKKWT